MEKILAKIPTHQLRDRLLFRLLLETGLRVGEALALYIEDLDMIPDDEHIQVKGKGGKRRTILLDDPYLVKLLRTYLKRIAYQHGPLFRAQKNGRGGSLSYQAVQQRWKIYCDQADIQCTLHQLRHTHATDREHIWRWHKHRGGSILKCVRHLRMPVSSIVPTKKNSSVS